MLGTQETPPRVDCRLTWKGMLLELDFSDTKLGDLTALVVLWDGDKATKCLEWKSAARKAVKALRRHEASMLFSAVYLRDGDDPIIDVVRRPSVSEAEVQQAIVAFLATVGIVAA